MNWEELAVTAKKALKRLLEKLSDIGNKARTKKDDKLQDHLEQKLDDLNDKYGED